MKKELTNQELLSAIRGEISTNNDLILKSINVFSTAVDKRFNGVDKRLDNVEDRLDGVEKILDGVENRLNGAEETMATKDDLTAMECRLVTKSYLDRKLANLQSDIMKEVRREDAKIMAQI